MRLCAWVVIPDREPDPRGRGKLIYLGRSGPSVRTVRIDHTCWRLASRRRRARLPRDRDRLRAVQERFAQRPFPRSAPPLSWAVPVWPVPPASPPRRGWVWKVTPRR